MTITIKMVMTFVPMIGYMIRTEGFVRRYQMIMKTPNAIIGRGCLEVTETG